MQIRLLGIYVQDEISLACDRLSLILGARLSAQRLDADRVEDPRTGEPCALLDR